MANFCNYEIHVLGEKNAALMVYASMPFLDNKEIICETGSDQEYELQFIGVCKWSVNFGVTDIWDREIPELTSQSRDQIMEEGENYWGYSLKVKSEVFNCDIRAHYWSEESEFDQFDQYINGECVKRRKIAYHYENHHLTEKDPDGIFNWSTLEFNGHEGEYDESVDGEDRDVDFMSSLMALQGNPMTVKDDQEDEKSELLEKLNGLLGDLENALEEAGVDPYPSSIGDTGFDMYEWTFSEGKREDGNGWSVAIPDGFVVTKSKGDRVFEVVPKGMENEDVDTIPVRILPGISAPGLISEENWMCHPYAGAGVAAIYATQVAEHMAGVMGEAPAVMSVGSADKYAYVLIQDTSGGSCSYHCTVDNAEKAQQLRVQTQYITAEQKTSLNKSVLEWLLTFKFDKPNSALPKESPLESDRLIDELKEGSILAFNSAVEEAQQEYNTVINGRIIALQFMAEHGLLDNEAHKTAREALTQGMEVKEFYHIKADELVEKLKSLKVGSSMMKKVYEKLKDMEDAKTELEVDDEKIIVTETDKTKEIQKKWKDEAEEIARIAKEEEEKRKAAEEEQQRKAAEEERKSKEKEEHKRAEETRNLIEKAKERAKSIPVNSNNLSPREQAKAIFDPVLKGLEEKVKAVQKEYDEEIKSAGQVLGLYRAFSDDRRSDRELSNILMQDKKDKLGAQADAFVRELDSLERKMDRMKDSADQIEQLSYIVGWYPKFNEPAEKLDHMTGYKCNLKKRVQKDREKWDNTIHSSRCEKLLQEAQINHAAVDLLAGEKELANLKERIAETKRMIEDKESSYQDDLKAQYEEILSNNEKNCNQEKEAFEKQIAAEDEEMDRRYKEAFSRKKTLGGVIKKPDLSKLSMKDMVTQKESPKNEEPQTVDENERIVEGKIKESSNYRKKWLQELMKPSDEIHDLNKKTDQYNKEIKDAEAKIKASEKLLNTLGDK